MRTSLRTVMALVFAFVLTVLAAPSAHADAYGSQGFGGFTYTYNGVTIGVSNCHLNHTINGSGNIIEYENANVACDLAKICNYRIDFKSYDAYNRLTRNDIGATQYGCWTLSVFNPTRPVFRTSYVIHWATTGKTCAVFYVQGVQRAAQCHAIYP